MEEEEDDDEDEFQEDERRSVQSVCPELQTSHTSGLDGWGGALSVTALLLKLPAAKFGRGRIKSLTLSETEGGGWGRRHRTRSVASQQQRCEGTRNASWRTVFFDSEEETGQVLSRSPTPPPQSVTPTRSASTQMCKVSLGTPRTGALRVVTAAVRLPESERQGNIEELLVRLVKVEDVCAPRASDKKQTQSKELVKVVDVCDQVTRNKHRERRAG